MHERQVTERLRAICLALPEAVEKEAWGDVPGARQDLCHGEAGRRARLGVVQGAARQPDGAGRRRSGSLLRAALCRPQGLDRHAPRRRAGLERGRPGDQAKLPAGRAQAAGCSRRMTARPQTQSPRRALYWSWAAQGGPARAARWPRGRPPDARNKAPTQRLTSPRPSHRWLVPAESRMTARPNQAPRSRCTGVGRRKPARRAGHRTARPAQQGSEHGLRRHA
jgi:hypothetical protein